MKHDENNPGEELHAGWQGRPLKSPTYQQLFETAYNRCFVREGKAGRMHWHQLYRLDGHRSVPHLKRAPKQSLGGVARKGKGTMDWQRH
jgi:hypothetical protein